MVNGAKKQIQRVKYESKGIGQWSRRIRNHSSRPLKWIMVHIKDQVEFDTLQSSLQPNVDAQIILGSACGFIALLRWNGITFHQRDVTELKIPRI